MQLMMMNTSNPDFPEWLEQPLKLTKSEIECPKTITSCFFNTYSLLETRDRLEHWLDASAKYNEEGTYSILRIFKMIHQLVEALWLLNHQPPRTGNKKDYIDESIPISADIDWSIRMKDQISRRPLSCLLELLSAFYHDDYIETIEKWKDIALSNGDYYEDVNGRKKLISFCKRAPHLIESMQIIKEQNIDQATSSILDEHDSSFFHLNKKDQEEPMKVIQNFFNQFDIQYVRNELWNILNALVDADSLTEDFSEILYTYEHLECLFEIAYYFFKKEDEANVHTIHLEVLYENMNLLYPGIIRTAYSSHPGWQNSVMYLDIYEIENPETVLRHFFDNYSLSNIRETLKACVENIAEKEMIHKEDFSFFNAAEKLIEGAWVINKRNNKPQDKECDSGLYKRQSDEKEEQANKDELTAEHVQQSRFNKRRYYLDDIEEYTLSTLCRIFKGSCDDSLKFTIKDWQLLILNNDFGERYNYKRDMAILIPFCENLQKLIEALYLLCVPLTKNDKYDILELNGSYLFLNEKEQANPYIVLSSFRQHFLFQHAQAELWDMVNAIVTVPESPKIRRSGVIWNFEQFLCIIKAAYLLIEEDAALLADLNRLQTEKQE